MTQRGKIVWRPTVERALASRMNEFSELKDFSSLHQWSIDKPNEFWARIWEFCRVVGERGERIIDRFHCPGDPSLEFIATRFFLMLN